MLTSHDVSGPVIRPRTEKLWTRVDPLGFRPNFRYEFEMDILDAVETESVAEVMIAGKVLKTGSTYNDYYGFGASRRSAIKEAEGFIADLEGAEIDVVVTTTMMTKAVFFDDKHAPFYCGAVRCFYAPLSWSFQNKDVPLRTDEEFEAWRNGEPGKDGSRLEDLISQIKAADAAGERRKGDLR
jgi:hypothetical protein